jgi:hypothetical protein
MAEFDKYAALIHALLHGNGGVGTCDCETCSARRKAADTIGQLDRLAPLCEEHGSGSGARSGCPYCAILKLQAALSRIDYLCGKPNDMEVSDYDVYYVESEVVKNVERALAHPSAERSSAPGAAALEIERAKTHGPDLRTLDQLEYTLARAEAAERDFIQVHKNCIAARERVAELERASLSSEGTREAALTAALKLVLDDWANANAIGDDAREQAEHALNATVSPVLTNTAVQEPQPKVSGEPGKVDAMPRRASGSGPETAVSHEQQPVAWLKERGDDQRRHVELHPHVADWMKKEGGWTVTPLYRAPASAKLSSEEKP